MKDFYLTPRGDLAINDINIDTNTLEINIITSFSNAICINFFLEDVEKQNINSSSLKVNFNIEKPSYNKNIRIVSGDEYMQQMIKIRLKSALGSIKSNIDIGSTLEELMHCLIDKDNVTNKLKTSIADAIKDIIPNPTIIINKPKSKYVNYSTGFDVIIIDNDKQYSINL